MMNMQSRNQYIQTLIGKRDYHLLSKKQKTKLLNEYCKNTGQSRKYIVAKIRQGGYIRNKTIKRTRNKKEYYDGPVSVALVKCWHIFDSPCGQRLEPCLKSEVNRLRKLSELKCSDKVTKQLKQISSATIDRKLKHQKEVEQIRNKYSKKKNPLLYQKIPIKVFSEQDRTRLGNIQIDLVKHCGQSARSEFICTLSNTDIATGWGKEKQLWVRGRKGLLRG